MNRHDESAKSAPGHDVALSLKAVDDSYVERHSGLMHDHARRLLGGNGQDWRGDDVPASGANLH